jgi:hypothetical protein
MERKIGSGKNVHFHQLATGRSIKSYLQLERKIQAHNNTVKKSLTKMRVHRKAKKSTPKTTIQSVSQAMLKLLTQNFFSAKLIYKCVMNDESFFKVDGNEWQQQCYYKSEDHPAIEDVKFIRKSKFPAKVLLWLAVSESGISEPVLFKSGLAEVYISKCLPILRKFIQKHHKN